MSVFALQISMGFFCFGFGVLSIGETFSGSFGSIVICEPDFLPPLTCFAFPL